MEIRQALVQSKKLNIKCPNEMVPEYITIHNTANDASAANEIQYMTANSKEVSFHIAVDDKEAIQGIPFNRNAWAAGDGNGPGNRKSIHIEICYSKSGGTRYYLAEANAIKLVAQLLKERGWGIDRVKKHQDWSGKKCPHRILEEGRWGSFMAAIQTELNGPQPTTSGIGIGSTVTVKKSATHYQTGQPIAAFVKGGKYKVLQVKDVAQSLSKKAYLLDGISSWVLEQDIDESGTSNGYVAPQPQPTPAPQPKKEYVYFPPNMGTWRVYPLNKAAKSGNEVGKINPTKFGGLEYEILGRPQANVATIKTSNFGTVNVYIGADSGAQIRVK